MHFSEPQRMFDGWFQESALPSFRTANDERARILRDQLISVGNT